MKKLINKSPFVFLLAIFILGILLYEINAPSIYYSALFCSLFCLIFAGVLSFLKAYSLLVDVLRIVSLFFSILFLGLGFSGLSDIRNNELWYGKVLENIEALYVEVIGTPVPKEKTLFLPAKVSYVLNGEKWEPKNGLLNVYIFNNDSNLFINEGSSFLIPNKLAEISNSGNPYAFDYAKYISRKGIYHQAFLNFGDLKWIKNNSGSHSLIQVVKNNLLGSIRQNVSDSTTASLIEATLLNERALLDNELWKAYSDTGIVHIIAISGMHVSIMFSILLFLLSWIKNKKYEWIKYFIAIPLVWFYILLTGYPASAVRAATMFTLIAVGITINRKGNAINTWAASGLLMLSYNTNWLFDVGMQLSFLCVLSIILLYPYVRKWYTANNVIVKYIWEGIAISISVQILVFPLVIYYFHQFPLWVLVANIPAAAFSFLLMTGSLLLFLLSSIGIPCIWLGEFISNSTNLFHHIVLFFSGLTPELFKRIHIDFLDFTLMMGVVILFCLFFILKNKLILYFSFSLTFVLVINFLLQDWKLMQQRRLIVYNIPGKSSIDYYRGKSLYPSAGLLQKGYLSEKQFEYNVLPARLAYRALDKLKNDEELEPMSVWYINNKKVLYLDQNYPEKAEQSFSVNYLILSDYCDFKPYIWFQLFQPEKIILDGSFSRSKALRWKDKLMEANIPVHSVLHDGAWVLEQ